MLKNLEYVAFDLKKDCQKATPDVTVSMGNDLVLIAIIGNASDCEYKKIRRCCYKAWPSIELFLVYYSKVIRSL